MFTRKHPATLIFALATLVFGTHALGQPIIYPANGQSAEQQQKDQAECNTWSISSAGFDPANPPPPATAPPPAQAPQGGVARGAVRGSLIGGVVSDDWGKGAAAGALVGGFRRADQNRNQAAQEQQYQQQYQQQLANGQQAYDRALSACMTGRGYTVN